MFKNIKTKLLLLLLKARDLYNKLTVNEKYMIGILFAFVVCFLAYFTVVAPVSNSLTKSENAYKKEKGNYDFIINNSQDIPSAKKINLMEDCDIDECIRKAMSRHGVVGISLQPQGDDRVLLYSKESFKYSTIIKMLSSLENNNRVVAEQIKLTKKQDGLVEVTTLVLVKK